MDSFKPNSTGLTFYIALTLLDIAPINAKGLFIVTDKKISINMKKD
jgi:hypothetical protein